MTGRDLVAAGLGAAATAAILLGIQAWRAPRRSAVAASASAASAAAAVRDAPPDDGEAWRAANANLAETVRATQRRLDRNEAEKKALQKELKEAKAKLVAAEGDGAPPRNEFDLSLDDWKELAKKGTVMARYPCRFNPEWRVGPEQAAALGLSPNDAAAVTAAYLKEEERIAAAVLAGCAKILGNAEVARTIGTRACTSVISEAVKDNRADLQLVADIRAGNVPMPPADQLDPFATMLLAQSGSMKALEADLATTFGPEEAHRLAFADELGSCSGSWGGPRPKR